MAVKPAAALRQGGRTQGASPGLSGVSAGLAWTCRLPHLSDGRARPRTSQPALMQALNLPCAV